MQFDLLKNTDGLVTVAELESGLNKLNLFQQPLAKEEISGIVKKQSSSLQTGLNFEEFLQVLFHCMITSPFIMSFLQCVCLFVFADVC